jgi:hypothetical protein
MQKDISLPAYFEQRYCNECLCIHWLELTPNNKEICHGEKFYPLASHPLYYARHLGHGYELRAKAKNLPLEWQILAERPKVLDEVDF